jgi:hypothetical protein
VSRLLKLPDEETVLSALLRQIRYYENSALASWLPGKLRLAMTNKAKRHKKLAREFAQNFHKYEPK